MHFMCVPYRFRGTKRLHTNSAGNADVKAGDVRRKKDIKT